MLINDTIAAIATSPGSGAIAIIRLSGKDAIKIVDKVFFGKNKLITQDAYTIHFGNIKRNNEIVDEVLVSIFKAPKSYTGENSVEISCHGSIYIQQRILNLLIKSGARTANPGEFTQRAFLNGKLDLSQAEAVADLISAESKAEHKVAIRQMRGGFTSDLQKLRTELLNFISLIELELDFSEEDVEFADRTQLKNLIANIKQKTEELINSFEYGNVIKKGVPVAIVGEPNVGKSTLLNALLNDDKAIVSDIAGTTRDAIEDTISLNGVLFRFIDTAGIRKTEDIIENLGIERTKQKMEFSEIILLMIDASSKNYIKQINDIQKQYPQKKVIPIVNKADLLGRVNPVRTTSNGTRIIYLSAKLKQNIGELENALTKSVSYTSTNLNDTIITNTRHLELLQKAYDATLRVDDGLTSGLSSDFIAQDIREILNHIGEITGEYTNDEVLGNIFKNFCIGK